MRPELPTFSDLHQNYGDPRVHPNGFIQLDLTETRRLHVWHPRLPYRQTTYHSVHDHVFGFVSHCYSGRLGHVQYTVVPAARGTHILWQAKQVGPEESVLKARSDRRFSLFQLLTTVVQPGQSYGFGPFDYHETLANEPTLTVIDKHGPTIYQGSRRRPSVAVPFGVAPDNGFRRDDVDVEVLWDLIADAYPRNREEVL